MEVDPMASYFGRMHAELVNRLMRHADYDLDESIAFSWALAKQLANGNVSCCIFVFMNILTCDIDYYLRYTQPRDGDRIISLFGLSTLIISHVMLSSMVYFNLIIRSSVLPQIANITGWLSTHSSILNFYVVYEICIYGYIGGSFNNVPLGLLITVMMLFEAFVFASLRKLLRYRIDHNRNRLNAN